MITQLRGITITAYIGLATFTVVHHPIYIDNCSHQFQQSIGQHLCAEKYLIANAMAYRAHFKDICSAHTNHFYISLLFCQKLPRFVCKKAVFNLLY